MQLVVFSKMLKDLDVSGLIRLAHEHGFDRYDLCIRPGHPANPNNVSTALAGAVHAMVEKDLSVGVHRCPHCGYTTDRDVNAAQTILCLAVRRYRGPVGRA